MAYSRSTNALDIMAARKRSPSFNSKGQVRGFRTRPGAPQSAEDEMAGLSDDSFANADGGARWAAMFPNSAAGQRFAAAPTLAPETPPDAAAMAATAMSSDFFTDPAQFGSMDYTPSAASPQSYVDATIKSATGYFDAQGLSRPTPGAAMPSKSGDQFKSQWGKGSILSGADYQTKLKRLLVDQDFDDSFI